MQRIRVGSGLLLKYAPIATTGLGVMPLGGGVVTYRARGMSDPPWTMGGGVVSMQSKGLGEGSEDP